MLPKKVPGGHLRYAKPYQSLENHKTLSFIVKAPFLKTNKMLFRHIL